MIHRFSTELKQPLILLITQASSVPQLVREAKVDNNQMKILLENNQWYLMQEIVNILKISKLSIKKTFEPALMYDILISKENLLNHI